MGRAPYSRQTLNNPAGGMCEQPTKKENHMHYKNAKSHNVRNYGFGNRNPKIAAENACKMHYKSFSTAKQISNRFHRFMDWCSNANYEIKDLRTIISDQIKAYAKFIETLVADKKLATSTGHDYISSVNQVMTILTGRENLVISVKFDTDIPSRSYIATINKASRYSAEDINNLDDSRFKAIVTLQLLLGLRFEESVKCNPHLLYKEAINKGSITIVDGTKGGRKRQLLITNQQQIEALNFARSFQDHHWSLIPQELNYTQFKQKLYKEKNIEDNFHSFRHSYSQTRYLELTGVECPLVTKKLHGKKHIQYIASHLKISTNEAKKLDKESRLIISKELGHNRISITNSYLG
jgi:hypothetical protein